MLRGERQPDVPEGASEGARVEQASARAARVLRPVRRWQRGSGRACPNRSARSSSACARGALRPVKKQGVPAYIVFTDATLAAIAEVKPRQHAQLAAISGVGAAKLERYADDVLDAVADQ